MSKRLAVTCRNGLYAAGVFTSAGLYSCSLPRPTIEEAIESAGGRDIPRLDLPQDIHVVEWILDLYDGIEVPELERVPLDLSGLSEKTQRVILALRRIPRGQTVTYGRLASLAGLPGAHRFVGNVMARNRHAPVVPCHRVVASNGLGGYGLGLDEKRALLRREGLSVD